MKRQELYDQKPNKKPNKISVEITIQNVPIKELTTMK